MYTIIILMYVIKCTVPVHACTIKIIFRHSPSDHKQELFHVQTITYARMTMVRTVQYIHVYDKSCTCTLYIIYYSWFQFTLEKLLRTVYSIMSKIMFSYL